MPFRFGKLATRSLSKLSKTLKDSPVCMQFMASLGDSDTKAKSTSEKKGGRSSKQQAFSI